MKSVRGVLTTLLFCVGLVFLGCISLNAAATPQPRYGGTLILSDQTEGVSIGFPAKMTQVYSHRQAGPAIETLLRTDKAGKITPWLATGIKEDAKAKTIVLTLRNGIKFHDGTEFNAEAVKWNLDIQTAAKAGGTDGFKSVDVVDNYTVRINLNEWDSTVSGMLSQSLGMIISPAAYKKNGEEWCARNPVGTGPFVFVSWDKDVRTVYKKNPSYWMKGRPYLDRVEFVPIADSQTRQFSLKKKEISIGMMLAPKDVAPLEKEGYSVKRGRIGTGAVGLVFNSADPKSPFADVRVRRAAQYAIDTKSIRENIFANITEPTNQWTYKGHWSYNPSIVGYPYNPGKAKQLLKEAGYPNGFKTKVMYRTNPVDDQLFAAIQGYLRAVGIETDLDPVLPNKFTQVAFQGGTWEGLLYSGHYPYPDSAAGLDMRYNGGGKYYTKMVLPEDYQKAVKNAVTAVDFKSKQRFTQEAIKLMIDKYCLILIIHYQGAINAPQPYVHDFGLHESPNTGIWTPEAAWTER